MRVLVTGSAGHLGEALVRTLRERRHEVAGLDLLAAPFTDHVGSIDDPSLLRLCMRGVDVVMHAATLHQPHLATHPPSAFVETNVTGTLHVLEAAVASGVGAVVFTSSTSTFGAALTPPPEQPAVWITEEVAPIPRNMYGVTKVAAENLCQLFHRSHGLRCIVLRTSRFFPEEDDVRERREGFDMVSLKVTELLYRRVDLADAVEAHILAAERAAELGFARYVVSAATPFRRDHLAQLRHDAPGVVRSLFPDYEEEYGRRGWKMLPGIDRVYDSARARDELEWRPRFDFGYALERLRRGESPFSALARAVGSKGYHRRSSSDGRQAMSDGG